MDLEYAKIFFEHMNEHIPLTWCFHLFPIIRRDKACFLCPAWEQPNATRLQA